MMNKSVMAGKPFAVLGDFWQPISGSRAGSRIGAPGALGRGKRPAGARGGGAGRRGKSFDYEIAANLKMSRTAQDVLEFDKLRELLRLRTTCAPGRRAVNGLEPASSAQRWNRRLR